MDAPPAAGAGLPSFFASVRARVWAFHSSSSFATSTISVCRADIKENTCEYVGVVCRRIKKGACVDGREMAASEFRKSPSSFDCKCSSRRRRQRLQGPALGMRLNEPYSSFSVPGIVSAEEESLQLFGKKRRRTKGEIRQALGD